MKTIASILFSCALAIGCGGKAKPEAAPASTSDTAAPVGDGSGSAAPVCHDVDTCEGHGTCIALCAGKAKPEPDCDAKCDEACPVMACP